jgi:hypothetical protein
MVLRSVEQRGCRPHDLALSLGHLVAGLAVPGLTIPARFLMSVDTGMGASQADVRRT